MPFTSVIKELQRPRSSAIIRPDAGGGGGGGDHHHHHNHHHAHRSGAISPIVEPCKNAPAVKKSETTPEFRPETVSCFTDANGRRALHYAAATGHFQVVKELSANRENVNIKDVSGYTPLHLAATEGHVEVVKLLLRSGANPDAQDEVHGNAPLHEAAWKGYSQTVEAICKRKCQLAIKNKGGFSALHLTCQQGHNQTCRILLLHGCSPDIKNNYGDTPLHTACRYGHAGVVRILISAFCKVNAVNKNGDTALHISAAMGRRKLTKILLEAGCDPAAKNKQGETAMDIALRKSFREVQEIIANAPPVVEHKVRPNSHKDEVSLQNHKHSKKHTSKGETKKSVHFSASSKYPHDSPYGCPMYPNLNDFPKPKLDSLPQEPLGKGEQYYVDLAGNIRKGPVGKVFNCYCVPLFEKVEAKLEKDKEELKHHIHTCHDSLNQKISSVEEKTSHQLDALNDVVKEKFADERMQCLQRNYRRSLKDKLEFERQTREQVEKLRDEMRIWLERKLNGSDPQADDAYFSQCMNDNHYVNLRSRKNSAESDSQVFYDKPKRCFTTNDEFLHMNGVSSRSKSETHLATFTDSDREVTSERSVITRTVPQDDIRYAHESPELYLAQEHQVNSSTPVNGDTQHDTGENIETNGDIYSHQQNGHMTDIMKSMLSNGSTHIPNDTCRNSPFSDSGYRTKFSPSPKNGMNGDQVLVIEQQLTRISCIENGQISPHNMSMVSDSGTLVPKKSSLV